MANKRISTPPIKEADIEQACVQFMEFDGWRAIKMEQNFSEKKRKTVGEPGMPDRLFIRYGGFNAEILWVEFKRTLRNGKPTKPSVDQIGWHAIERTRGALTWIAGLDFPATLDGYMSHYKTSGLARNVR